LGLTRATRYLTFGRNSSTPRFLQAEIFLDPAIIEKLRSKAEKRGIGYQTMLKIIVHEHVDEY
jgi:hypothetical protein